MTFHFIRQGQDHFFLKLITEKTVFNCLYIYILYFSSKFISLPNILHGIKWNIPKNLYINFALLVYILKPILN